MTAFATGPAPGFENEPLRNMVAVGAVTADSARVWIRSERYGRVRLDYWPQDAPDAIEQLEAHIADGSQNDRTACVTLPPPGRGGEGLRGGVRYAFRAMHADGGELLGEGGFETAPPDVDSAPARFAIALLSCNQPFDQRGRPAAAGADMLRAMHGCLDEHATKRVFMLGDQMYTDYPPSRSLFNPDYFPKVSPSAGCKGVTDCSATQVRRLLQQRYRHFWNIEGWRHLHARYACYPIIDDHEIVDNWGAVPAHATMAWRDFIEGAKAAYFDYQGARVESRAAAPEDFDYEVEYGPAAIYVLDLRSNRKAGNAARVYSDDQLRRLRGFLERYARKQVLLLVFSVPAIHLPKWGARLGRALTWVRNEDFSDRWSTAGHVRDRDRVLCLLHDHQRANPDQRLVLLSGDIHIACAHEIAWDDGTRPLMQLVSSGITNKVGRFTQAASKLSILANRRLTLYGDGLSADVRLLRGAGRKARNPYTKLNLGLVEFQRDGDGRFAIRYLVYGHRRGAPVCVYRSPWR